MSESQDAGRSTDANADDVEPGTETSGNPVADNAVDQILDAIVSELGGRRREGQDKMAHAVSDALENEGHLLVQAGTGTGKSIGYLAPVAEWTTRTGKRAIVSTATLALQRQIQLSDGPRVADAVEKETGKRPEIAVLKGWNNYVCLRKAGGGYPEEDALFSRDEGEFGASALGTEVVRAREWAMSTDTGDRDDMVPGVSDRAWRQVSIDKTECVGAKCPLRDACFPMAARAAAADADIVVTNHSMLGVQAGGTPVLPDADAVVVDEAHALADRVTSQLTVSISRGELAGLARVLRASKIEAVHLEEAGTAFGKAVEEVPEGRLAQLPDAVIDALMVVLRTLQTAQDDVAGLPNGTDTQAATKAVARTRVTNMVSVVENLLSDDARDGALVPWIRRDQDDRTVLYLAPLDVSAPMADALFEDRPVVLTSATLKLGGKFDHVARATGLDYPSQGPWRGIDVGTPFNYPKQGILYVATHLPGPTRDGGGERQFRELVELIEASHGGALCLFTSRRAAEEAAEFARDELDLPIFLQGEDQLSTLIQKFASDDAASLFGTISLWQGVDVPGHTCRLVTIDRIPFPRPNEALTEAREVAAKKAHRNAFMEVYATQAALLLAQGAGRLLRRTSDRGVVAVLDRRLRTARYAGYLLASLPNMWRTESPEIVRDALRRLAQTGAGE
ncbi:ATP-dependent DNA helicase [Neoactinobaculum massilliense]|uniref:ATP-dependent DNA helicase n=1 Tax=Neoactinobaculum massilliense TaxID=2364794 RepID=UPI000F537548|nr:ATP-dependent DNA helicase [Neoactinobaculum massilliense]